MRALALSRRVVPLLLCVAGILGCGASDASRPSDRPDDPPEARLGPVPSHHGLQERDGTPVPDEGPVVAVTKALRALDSGNLEQAYDFLPSTYQVDVDRFIRAFADRTDAEVWTALHGCFQKSLQVLRLRKDLILDSLGDRAENPSLAELDRLWNPLIDNAEALLSGLADHHALKTFDSREYLRTIGSPVYRRLRAMHSASERDLIANLARTDVRQVVNIPGGAILLIQFPAQPEPIEVSFVEVEGSWLPQPLVMEWEPGWRQIRGFVDRLMLERFSQRKEEILEALADFDAVLNRLLAAETAADFTVAAAPLALELRNWFAALTTPPARPDTVTITISSELSDDQQSLALGDLEALSDDPARCTYSSIASDGRTLILVRPIVDVTAFTALLTEKWPAIATISPDAERRTIAITISGALPGRAKSDP